MSLFSLRGSLCLAPWLLVAALAGCGGNVVVSRRGEAESAGGGSGGAGGEAGGAESAGVEAPFVVVDAISGIFDDWAQERAGVVIVADKAPICDAFTEGAPPVPNARYIQVIALVWDPVLKRWWEPKGPGSFPIVDWTQDNPVDHGGVYYNELDSSGYLTSFDSEVKAVSGMITIVSATPEGAFAGNVDVVMNTGVTFQFDFDATASCPALFP